MFHVIVEIPRRTDLSQKFACGVMKFWGVIILQGVEISIFLSIFECPLQQWSTSGLPVLTCHSLKWTEIDPLCLSKNLVSQHVCC